MLFKYYFTIEYYIVILKNKSRDVNEKKVLLFEINLESSI